MITSKDQYVHRFKNKGCINNTANLAGLQEMITSKDQYMHKFQNKGGINNTQTLYTYCT